MLAVATALFALLACSDDVTGPSEPAIAPAGEISASLTGIPGSGSPLVMASLLDTGLCMDVAGGQVAWGTPTITWSCHGGTTIKVSSAKGHSTARVRVGGRSRVVTVSPRASNLAAVGESTRLRATVVNSKGDEIKNARVNWTSLNPAIATVDAEGTIVATSAGVVRVVAAVQQDADTATVIVGDIMSRIASISVTPASTLLTAGDSILLVATAHEASGAQLPGVAFVWESSNTSFARIGAGGVVRALAEGFATITVQAVGSTSTGSTASTSGVPGKSATASINVRTSGEPSIVLSPAVDTIHAINDAIQLTATVRNAQGALVTGASVNWVSLNPGVVTVDGMGKVVAKAVGVALITAASGGKMDTAVVYARDAYAQAPVVPAGNPQPRSGDRVLFDYRAGGAQDLQRANNLAEAVEIFGSSNLNSKWGFTTDLDGNGTRALIGRYAKAAECNDQTEHKVNLYFPDPEPREVYIQWKLWLGRTRTGESTEANFPAMGAVGAYDPTNEACDGKGGKRFRLIQQPVTIADGTTYSAPGTTLQWTGRNPNTSVNPEIALFDERRFHIDTKLYQPEFLQNQVLVHTFYAKASSGFDSSTPLGFTRDGIYRMWVNGVLVLNLENIEVAPRAFDRFNIMSRINSPAFDMTDYVWDMVAWQPK